MPKNLQHHSLFAFSKSLIILSTTLLPLPSYAANFSTLSNVSLTITNFTLLPTSVNTVATVDAVAITNEGEMDVTVDGDAVFESDQITKTALGSADFSTSIIGKGTDYLGATYIVSQLIGQFFVPANTPFSFGIQADATLANDTNNLALAPLSSLATLKLTLRDTLNNTKLTLLDFYGGLNTNAVPLLDQDSLALSMSPDAKVTGSQLITQFGGANESLLFSLTANYQFLFAQDTELLLTGRLDSCNFASNSPDVCVSVPEPSERLGLIAGILFLFTIRMKKQIGKFPRQPFIKQFVQNFITNIRG